MGTSTNTVMRDCISQIEMASSKSRGPFKVLHIPTAKKRKGIGKKRIQGLDQRVVLDFIKLSYAQNRMLKVHEESC